MNWGSSVRRLKVRGSQAGPSGPPARRAMEARQSFTVRRLSQGNWFSSTWGRSWLSFLQGQGRCSQLRVARASGASLGSPRLGGGSPVVLEVREVIEDVGVRFVLGEGEAWVGEVAEHLLDVRVDPAGEAGLSWLPCSQVSAAPHWLRGRGRVKSNSAALAPQVGQPQPLPAEQWGHLEPSDPGFPICDTEPQGHVTLARMRQDNLRVYQTQFFSSQALTEDGLTLLVLRTHQELCPQKRKLAFWVSAGERVARTSAPDEASFRTGALHCLPCLARPCWGRWRRPHV